MVFRSILYGNDAQNGPAQIAQAPACFGDLNLDQVVGAVTAGKEVYNLSPFFHSPLHDASLVRHRQEIAQDLEDEALLKCVESFAQQMRVVRRYLTLMSTLQVKHHREGWLLEAAVVYCDAVSRFLDDLQGFALRSRGLLDFRAYLLEYVASSSFQSLRQDASETKSLLSGVRYTILIKDTVVRVYQYEGEIDYSEEIERTFAKFGRGAAEDYRSQETLPAGLNRVTAKILDCVARLYPDAFAHLDAFCERHGGFVDETIHLFDREVQFYVAYLRFLEPLRHAGLAFCYPQITTEDKEIVCHGGFDLMLAAQCVHDDVPIVPNDLHLTGPERIIVVSGPNQGGKTTFARMFGQLHYIASLGLPVPGQDARLYLPDCIYTHFERQEDIHNLRGRLLDDLMRLRDILARATPRSIVIMNEVFSSTALQDAVLLSTRIMERIIELDLLSVWVTFIDELASLSDKSVSMVSTVTPHDPASRTFRIVRRPADGLAYAITIAERHRLTHDLLKERIKE